MFKNITSLAMTFIATVFIFSVVSVPIARAETETSPDSALVSSDAEDKGHVSDEDKGQISEDTTEGISVLNNFNNLPQNLTIIVNSIVCDSETDLPNWGDNGPSIDSSTAASFIASHIASCSLESGWDYQWGYGAKLGFDGVTDPGPSFTGLAPASPESYNTWNQFGPTDASGSASVTISDLQGASDVWVRESLQTGFIPFTEPPTYQGDDKSAELYCDNDVLHYDNYDAIYGAQLGSTYYCVSFNTLATTANTPPTITLIGGSTISLVVNTNFIDPGASSTDAEDGDLTATIITTGSVATTTIGTYTLVYSVTDSGGLSTSTTRTVNVTAAGGPTASPTITLTLIGPNPFTINVGDVFTDPGVTATSSDGSIVTVSSSTDPIGGVTSSVVGTFTITYVGTSPTAGTATTTRTVNVVVPPTNPPGGGGGGGGGGSSYGGGGSYGGGLLSNFTASPTISTPTALTCPLLTKYLRFGYDNDPVEVVKLQSFLRTVEGATYITVSGFFDENTLTGVNAFQTKYLSQVMGPWGATRPSGYVYITTQKKVNEIACASAFIILPNEQVIIDAYRARQAGIDAGTITPGQIPVGDDLIGLNTGTSTLTLGGEFNDGTELVDNTASAANASILTKLRLFFQNLFRRQ